MRGGLNPYTRYNRAAIGAFPPIDVIDCYLKPPSAYQQITAIMAIGVFSFVTINIAYIRIVQPFLFGYVMSLFDGFQWGFRKILQKVSRMESGKMDWRFRSQVV